LRCLLRVAGNLLRRRALLIHGGDGVDRLLGRGLDSADLLTDDPVRTARTGSDVDQNSSPNAVCFGVHSSV